MRVGIWFSVGRTAAGLDFRAVEVRFQHSAPPDTRAREALFGCPVRFSCLHTELVMKRAMLDLPIRTADPRES
jgi:hypothetical protein